MIRRRSEPASRVGRGIFEIFVCTQINSVFSEFTYSYQPYGIVHVLEIKEYLQYVVGGVRTHE